MMRLTLFRVGFVVATMICGANSVQAQVGARPKAAARFEKRGPAFAIEGYFVRDLSVRNLVAQNPELTIDHVSREGFEVWGPAGLGRWLSTNKVAALPLHKQPKVFLSQYPTPEATNQMLAQLHEQYPEFTELTSIGNSVRGRPLLVMKITSHPHTRDPRPEFKFIANMHGDEIVGRELMILLIKDLLANYGKDPGITNLVDHLQIYILPSMNPDGAANEVRANAQGVDLNRDFPDFTTSDDKNVPDGRAPETQAVMRWQAQHHFVLSANFHGGAEVVSYGWDTSADRHPKFDLIYSMSLDYARLSPYIGHSTEFKNGVTNGYEWYEVNGGMQDWSYYWFNDLDFTVELSGTKWPSYSKIEYYYQQNRPALLNFISQTPRVAGSVR